MYELTEAEKAFCIETAERMNEIKSFKGGAAFIVDMFRELIRPSGLTVVDQNDPRISLRREVMQELFDALWTARSLRQMGFTVTTARSLGLADLYASHGVAGLQRFLEVSTDCALHNAGLEGFARSLSPERSAP